MAFREFLKRFVPGMRNAGKTPASRSEGPGTASLAKGGKRVSKKDLEGFDWKFYVGFYPDLKSSGISSRKKATRHWLQYGCAEGRIGGLRHRSFRDNFQILDNYLKSTGPRAAGAEAMLGARGGPLINILTRSNRRPRFFQDNRTSVAGQTYKRYRQLVSYENDETLKYLTEQGLPESDLIRVVRKPAEASHPYNLFVNELMDQVTEGWIMFLDDDDLFTTPHALSILASQLEDESRLVIWRTWFPDKTVPSTTDVHQISPGGITSCCFAFHSKHRKKAQWHEFKAGDYRCFDQLRQFLPPVFLDDILARINYTDCSAGWGEARDKQG